MISVPVVRVGDITTERIAIRRVVDILILSRESGQEPFENVRFREYEGLALFLLNTRLNPMESVRRRLVRKLVPVKEYCGDYILPGPPGCYRSGR